VADKVLGPAKEGNSQPLCWEQRALSTLQYWISRATAWKMITPQEIMCYWIKT